MECVNCDCVNKAMKNFEASAFMLLKKAKRVSNMTRMKATYKERQKALLLAEQEEAKKKNGHKAFVYNKYTKKAESLDFEVPSLETFTSGTTHTDRSPIGTRLSVVRSSDASVTDEKSHGTLSSLSSPKQAATPHPIVRSPDASITNSFKTSPTVSQREATKHPIERSACATYTTNSLKTSDAFKTSPIASLARSSSGSLTDLINATTTANRSTSTNSTITSATTPVLPKVRDDYIPSTVYTKTYAMRQGNLKENRVLKVMVKPSLGGVCDVFLVFLDAHAHRCLDLWLTVAGANEIRHAKLDGKPLKRVENGKN